MINDNFHFRGSNPLNIMFMIMKPYLNTNKLGLIIMNMTQYNIMIT